MATQKILWTPLPQGAGNAPGALSLVVFVAPQLSAGATLSGFGDFLDWPKTLATLSFSVSINGAVVAKDLKPTVPAGASALWGKFFASQTAVTSFETPKPAALQDLKVRSYGVGDVVRHMKELHRGMLPPNVNALQEHALPSAKSLAKTVFEAVPPPPGASLVPDLKGLASELGLRESVAAAGALSRLRPELAPSFTPGGRVSVSRSRAVSVKAADFLEARVFANQPVATASAVLALETKLRSARLGQLAEFHDILAVLGEYPFLLTQLGLAFELTFPGAAPASAGSAVSVTADWSKAGPETAKRLPASVATALAPGAFVPASSEGHIVRGFLKAGDAALFSSTQVDADGAVAQLVQLSDALTRRFSPAKRSAKQQQKDDALPEALPALRTAGMSLARQGQGASVRAAMLQGARHAEDLSAGKTPILFAEDLTRGLRVDVREVAGGKPGPWRSLCGRAGTYEVKGLAPQTSIDEGFVRAAAIEQKGKDGVHVHESLFRWTGWSLVVPRPGSPADPVPSKLAADPNWPLKTTFDVPPTAKLPRLRFGRTYQMRVRVADLAGRGPLAADASEAQVTPPETFLRFDPVPPPALVLRADAVEGESAERVVIRSYNATPESDGKPTAEKNARLVAPPPTTVELAERHGMFDLPAGGMDGAKTYAWLTQYQGAFPEKRNARKRLAYLKETRPLAQVAMPYLADPLAEAAAVRGLPTPMGKTAQRISYGGRAAWPALQPFLIALVEGAPGSQWDAASRTLTVSLPKATSVRLNLSSVPLDAARLDELGQWSWLMEGKSGVQKSLFVNTALIGGNWQLTPWRTVTLVHAVQKPLLSPDVLAATLESRLLGETHADLASLLLACDALSSDRVELAAAWDEVTDGPPTWSAKGRGGPPVTALGNQNLGDKVVEFKPPARFTVAGGRVATPQKLTGTTIPLNFDDEVPTSGSDVRLDDTEGRGLAFYEPAKRRLRRTNPDGRQLSPQGPLRFDFPDTRHRLVTLSAVATTRFREFYPQSIWSDPDKISRKSEKTVAIHVPSTARPEAPEIAFVVPIFRWTRKPERSSRQTGLRVYLERPWFSSGDDEKLAVVLLPNGKGDSVPNAFLPYVTQWGADPIWNAPGVARQAVRVADLPLVAGGRGGPKVSAGFKPPIDAKIGTVPPAVANIPPKTDKPPVAANVPPTPGGAVFKAPPVMTVPPIAFLPRQEQLFPLPEIPRDFGSESVGIAEFDVDYDAERGLWYADIPLVSPAHTPFLRLALARYQPYSVPGAHLSRVVLADFAQLLPERTLTLVRGPRVRVTLSGTLPQVGVSTNVEAFAQVQTLTGEGELGWTNVRERIPMSREGDVFRCDLPALPTPSPARVLVMEIEKIGSESRLSYAESLPL